VPARHRTGTHADQFLNTPTCPQASAVQFDGVQEMVWAGG